MSHSTHRIELVLVYNNQLDKAVWVTKSQASLMMRALGERVERVIEGDPEYEAVAKLAGPKPEFYLQTTENYNATEGAGPEQPEPESPLPESGPPGS